MTRKEYDAAGVTVDAVAHPKLLATNRFEPRAQTSLWRLVARSNHGPACGLVHRDDRAVLVESLDLGQAEARVYYDRRIMHALKLDPHRTTLLVVDMQERLLPAMPANHQRRIVAANELLLDTARRLKVHTIATEQYPKGLGHTVSSLRALFDAFDVAVFEKTQFSACGIKQVTDALALTDARTVIVTGMETHVCVFQTVRDLLQMGYHVHVPFDAVASRDPECKRVALEALRECGAKVTTAETVVFDLLRDANHPEFRAISARVKAMPIDVDTSR